MTRVWGKTDPFAFPASEFHFGLLRAVEPFLRVHRTTAASQLGPNDKFKGGQMNRDALDTCLQVITPSMVDYERSFKEPRTELNVRPRHLELIRQVEKFTRPTELALYEDDAAMAEEVGDENELGQKGFTITLAAGDEDDKLVAKVYRGKEVEEAPGGSSTDDEEGLHMDTEAAPEDVPDKGRTDARVFVFNEGPRNRADELEKPYLSAQRCTLVGEFKDDEDWNAIAQAAAYARVEARRNLSSRHYKPLYLLAFSKTKFTYAILKPEGYILTGGNKVTDAAYADFVNTTNPGSTPWPKKTMDTMLEAGISYLRRNYSDKRNPKYPKRAYVVGDLLVAPQWYTLPSTEVMDGFFSPDAKKFYEGLLRIAVGDRVLKFTPYHVMAALSVRMAMSTKTSAFLGADFSKGLAAMQGARAFEIAALGGFRVGKLLRETVEDGDTKRQRLIFPQYFMPPITKEASDITRKSSELKPEPMTRGSKSPLPEEPPPWIPPPLADFPQCVEHNASESPEEEASNDLDRTNSPG
ncbi:hypothetical protein SELMODRAFT_410804 [Selaginella moellendorffii]|uniref:Uncharacterized protein n=1 Tax=Selaginella moellendorffii TaxID=88036 RepID=D8RFX5_SELML|nr:hypothetical protein SELMODRAFT_410804 [Selaginella moellendorffii]